MAKINELKAIQKFRSEEQMQQALQDFIKSRFTLHIPVDDDDPDIVLGDAIHELLEARKIVQTVADCDLTRSLDAVGEKECPFCLEQKFWKDGSSPLLHDPSCPIAKARKLLALAGKE